MPAREAAYRGPLMPRQLTGAPFLKRSRLPNFSRGLCDDSQLTNASRKLDRSGLRTQYLRRQAAQIAAALL